MSKVKRTYLISYGHSQGTGRMFHERDTDDAPTMEQVENMEKKIEQLSGVRQVVIMNICLLQNEKDLQE